MSNRGLSSDIELAIQDSIEGLQFDLGVTDIEDNKMKAAVKSKISSFSSAKKLLEKWVNSPNAPNHTKIQEYTSELVDAGEVAKEQMRTALRKKVKWHELDADKRAAAVEAKPFILESIQTLNSGIVELRLQLDNDEINFSDKEYKIGFPERMARGELFNTKELHKDWYNKEEDAVKICPYGSEGEIIELWGLKIQLPEPPVSKKNILFSDKPRGEQYWRRQPMPKGLNKETEDEYIDYILEEYRRRIYGVWFMNNGKLTYMTGHMYFWLQWYKDIDSGDYSNFRIAQNNLSLHTKACEVDRRCLGQAFGKSRRTGFTLEKLSRKLNLETMTKNFRSGLTSKSGKDAEEAFAKKQYAFANLPFFFKPVVKGSEDSKSSIEFSKPSDRSKAAKLRQDRDSDDYLNTVSDWRNTTNDAYDSLKLNDYLADECFAKGTKILMADMSFKNIEDIKVGDWVTVDGGKKVQVGKTVQGEDMMYRVVQPYGKDYIVNSQHRLYVDYGGGGKGNDNVQIPLKVKDYLNFSEYKKRITRRIVSKPIEFDEKDLPIDPYVFGVWLGDGYSSSSRFVLNKNEDEVILDYLVKYFGYSSLKINEEGDNYIKINFTKKELIDGYYRNNFVQKLKDLNVYGNKRVPDLYKKSSLSQRLEIINGIIDTDGTKSKRSNSHIIAMSRKDLMEDIYYLLKSCGICCSEITESTSNFNTQVYRITFNDYNGVLNPKVLHKKSSPKNNFSRRSRMYINEEGWGKYYGITLIADNDDDRKLILEDYTVTFNCAKWEKPVNFLLHWKKVAPTMDESGIIVGKAWLGSTFEARDKGGREGKIIFEGSDPKKRNKTTGRTRTGLYQAFMPIDANSARHTDKYGVCHQTKPAGHPVNQAGEPITEGAKDYFDALEAEARKIGQVEFNEHKRNHPRNIQDMFRDKVTDSAFNLINIQDSLDYLDILEGASDLPVIEGDFSWKDGQQDTEVIWTPRQGGRFRITWLPPKDMRNQKEWKNGHHSPKNHWLGAGGLDPFGKNQTQDGRGSKGSFHFINRPNAMYPETSKQFVLEYIHRPPTLSQFYEDALMAAVFYGYPIFYENDKSGIETYFEQRGYLEYLMLRPERYDSRKNKKVKERGAPSRGIMIDAIYYALNDYINEYVGELKNGDMSSMYFERTLRDWMKFEPSNRTAYDASISSGFALCAIQTDPPKQEKEVKVELSVTPFRMYRNKGNISETI